MKAKQGMTKTRKDHPFFCFEKNTRKTAWDTPKYLIEQDWAFIAKLIPVLEGGSEVEAWALIWDSFPRAEDFFNRVIGWPEGCTYCRDKSYFCKCGLPMIIKNKLPKLKKALAQHTGA